MTSPASEASPPTGTTSAPHAAFTYQPALDGVRAIAIVTWAALPASSSSHTTGIGAASIGLYFTNWLVIARGNAPLGPFGHLWSLAIEEQFYLVWPIVVIASVKLGSRRVGVFLAAVVGAAASAIYRATLWQNAKTWGAGTATAAERTEHVHDVGVYWYRSTLTRSDGLLIGCALAVVVVSLRGPTAARLRARLQVLTGWDAQQLSRYARRLVAALGLLGAIVAEWIAWTNHHHVYPEFLIGPGFPLFEIAVGLVIVNLVINVRGVMARVLAWKPLVWIGRRSYAIYVLHPVFILGLSALLVDTQPVRALAVGLSILFAGLSYRYYEAPILRLKSRFGAGRETPPAEVSTDGARLVGALREES